MSFLITNKITPGILTRFCDIPEATIFIHRYELYMKILNWHGEDNAVNLISGETVSFPDKEQINLAEDMRIRRV